MTSFAGISLNKPIIMGIINVTPDSFSDGGENFCSNTAIARGLQMADEGADIIDVGGESTRPGALPVSSEDEISRVIPVVRGLVDCGAKISVDTTNAKLMERAIDSGAKIINDVTALNDNPKAVKLIAEHSVSVILMHMKGKPETMQDNPCYQKNAPREVKEYLSERIRVCQNEGIDKTKIAIDPGFGFGKSTEHNVQILNDLELLVDLGYPVVIGLSRKSFLGELAREIDTKRRLAGSLASAVLARLKGAHIFRVHDVFETKQALRVVNAIQN